MLTDHLGLFNKLKYKSQHMKTTKQGCVFALVTVRGLDGCL